MRTFARNIDRLMIPDNFLGTRLVKGGIPAEKMKKNVNPFFVDDYQPCYEPGEFILYVGRLVRQKGVFTLIRAMSLLSNEGPPMDKTAERGRYQFGVKDKRRPCGLESNPQSGLTTRAAFVTNICPHYRVKTFETLAQKLSVKFFFYSAGNERYWQQRLFM